jgi:fibronectin-binding autotransporter adhesin
MASTFVRYLVSTARVSQSLLAALCLAAAAVITLLAAPASASTAAAWNGSGGNLNWSNSANWNPTANAPTTSGTFDLTFGGTNQAVASVVATVNDVGTVNIGSLSFTNSGTLAPDQNAFFNITGGTLALNGSTITTTAAAGTNNPFGSNSDGDFIFSAITLAGESTVTTSNLHNLSLGGNISGNGSLVFDDSSVGTTEYVYLSGTNTYSGGTQIRGGFVQTASRVDAVTQQASTSNNFALGSGAVTVSDNGTLLVRNSSTVSNALTISGSGAGSGSLTGSFGVAGQTAVYSGPITVAGNTRFSTASAGANDTSSKFIITGAVDLGSNTLTLRSGVRAGQTLGLLIQVSGAVSGAGGVVIEGAAAGSRVLMDGDNDYTGGTTVTTGMLIAGSSSALGTGFLAVNTLGLDLNGQELAVGALSGSVSGVIRSDVAGPATLITTASTNSTYDGTILDGSGTVGLTKAGSGVLTLTGSNTYTGVTGVDGGVVALESVGAIGATGDITFGGGTLRYSASNQVDYSSRIKDSGSAASIDTNGETVTFANAIASSNVGGLTKTGSGTLFLNAANQYTGTTTVAAGTLAGTGSVLDLLEVAAGAVFDPGSGPSDTTIFGVGDFSQAAGGTTKMQVNGTTAGSEHDQVLVSGSSRTVSWGGLLELSLSGSYANFTQFNLFSGFTSQSGNLSGISLSAASPYSGLTFGGPLAGVWSTEKTPEGQYLTFDQKTGILSVVPEPSTTAVVALGIAIVGLSGLRRRRGGGAA